MTFERDARTVQILYVNAEEREEWSYWRERRGLLSDEERARFDAFTSSSSAREYLCARALVRLTLSEYTGIPPGELRFGSTPFGKPFLANPLPEPLHFSLSHAGQRVALAVSRNASIGIDLEVPAKRQGALEIAEEVLSPLEWERFKSLAPRERAESFFEYWTLKEAYCKARGTGLSIPLGQLEFLLGESAPARVRAAFGPGVDDDPAAWSFLLSRPEGCSRLAIAVRAPEKDLRVVLFRFREGIPELLEFSI